MGHRCISLLVIDTIYLGEALCNQLDFILINFSCSVSLYFENPLATHNVPVLGPLNYVPGMSFIEAF